MTVPTGKMNELRIQFGSRCMYCGNDQLLDFAHIIPTALSGRNSRGSMARYMDVKNNPQCYVLLCKKCHEMQHLYEVLLKHPELKRKNMDMNEIFNLGEFIEKRRLSATNSFKQMFLAQFRYRAQI